MIGYVPLNERPHGGHARLLDLALANRPQRVLDMGCSSGYLGRPVALFGPWDPRPHPYASLTRRTLVETIERAGYRVLVLDHTAPVPLFGTAEVERMAHPVASLSPSLFAYQLLVAATPA